MSAITQTAMPPVVLETPDPNAKKALLASVIGYAMDGFDIVDIAATALPIPEHRAAVPE